jgi:hypothetical protein
VTWGLAWVVVLALALVALCLGAALWVAGEADRRDDGRRP